MATIKELIDEGKVELGKTKVTYSTWEDHEWFIPYYKVNHNYYGPTNDAASEGYYISGQYFEVWQESVETEDS